MKILFQMGISPTFYMKIGIEGWILFKADELIGYWLWSQDKPIFVIGSNMIKIYKDSSVKCQSRCGNMRRYNNKSKNFIKFNFFP